MYRISLFIGLTRPVSFAGLPMFYLSLLMIISITGFLITKSFLYIFVTGLPGYLILRAMAAYDPKLIEVVVIAMRSAPFHPAQLTKSGVIYRA